MKEGHYIQKSLKLEKQLAKYLNGFEPVLLPKYRKVKSKAIFANLKIPFFSTPMYDSLLVLNSRMMGLKKGMNDADIGVEEFVGLQVENL